MTASAPSAFVWDRCFLLCSSRYVLDRHERPYRRLSATIIVSSDRPFRLQAGGRPEAEYAGILIAPNVLRENIDAQGCRVALLDVGLTTPAFDRLAPALPGAGVRALSDRELDLCRATISRFDTDSMSCADARRMFDTIVEHIAGDAPRSRARDPRVMRVIELVDAHSFDEISVADIAARIGLSESRLRALFREEMGCPLSQYSRWANTWKALHRCEEPGSQAG